MNKREFLKRLFAGAVAVTAPEAVRVLATAEAPALPLGAHFEERVFDYGHAMCVSLRVESESYRQAVTIHGMRALSHEAALQAKELARKALALDYWRHAA